MATKSGLIRRVDPAIVSTGTKHHREGEYRDRHHQPVSPRPALRRANSCVSKSSRDQQQQRISDGISPLSGESGSTSGQPCTPPPVGEIQIPTLHNKNKKESSNHRNHEHTDYEQLYFRAARRNYSIKKRYSLVTEENRRLKRHLIELQKKVFSTNRNKRPITTEAWTVPPAAKRSKEVEKCTVPQSVSTEEPLLGAATS